METLNAAQVAAIPQEVKEAVCNAIVNLTVERVSGAGRYGRHVYGYSPRRSIFSGQLLPRFDAAGQEDDTSDIRIAAVGVDLHVLAAAHGNSVVTPQFSFYVRVLPDWRELNDSGLDLAINFKLRRDVQDGIEARIRELRTARFQAARLATPDWPNLNPQQREDVRARRADIQLAVRREAYLEVGIELEPEEESAEELGLADDAVTAPRDEEVAQEEAEGGPDGGPAVRIGLLLQSGRAVPFHLLEPAPIPSKWRRVDVLPPSFTWSLGASEEDLSATLVEYNAHLREVVTQQVSDWISSSEGISEVWRDVDVQPQDAVSEQSWLLFRARLAQIAPQLDQIRPPAELGLQIERNVDFVDARRLAVRILLDNGNLELPWRDALRRCEAVFNTSLSVEIPAESHLPLQLDRVEPSYRFRDFLTYPAIGLNSGVVAREVNDRLHLTTTWAPRFVQPRIVPRNMDVPLSFFRLADPAFDVAELSAIPREYDAWVSAEEQRLRPIVRDGLSTEDADRESTRLAEDTAAQRREAEFIERGIRLLSESQRAFRELATHPRGVGNPEVERRAAPYRAWLLTNQSFLDRERGNRTRGWRLFQVAFILAHVPTFSSRMEEYRTYHDPVLDESAASLLYFPTGGGKSEAFYGALLFAMFLDRLRGKDRGVTAMIRYPLRLLTLQQGQRLLKLVAFAELVRRRESLGHWPFEIGFWVGGTNTPNRYSYVPSVVPLITNADHPNDARLEEGGSQSAEEQREAAKYREFRSAFNKVPECPVCGSHTGLRRNEIEGATAKRLGIYCFNHACAFNQAHGEPTALPFLLTDDTIYSRAPSIVLGTVDKLAMLGQRTTTIRQLMGMFGLARGVGPTGHLHTPPNEGDIAALLEQRGYAQVFPAFRAGERIFSDPLPSLIIQDEAHLLEESLGTFSGLFDSLLDQLFREIDDLAGRDLSIAQAWLDGGWAGLRMPKYIAATATISNPERQLEVLYQRRPLRFPCPGPDIYRSFFAEPAPAPSTNAARVALAHALEPSQAPERTAPWMRLFVSMMTNDATHTVTSVAVLASFHTVISHLWDAWHDPAQRVSIIEELVEAQGSDEGSVWRANALRSVMPNGMEGQLLALFDLHRIALAYVTNKKGGDQVMDALDAAVRLRHRFAHERLEGFSSRLISGGIGMMEIQEIMEAAQATQPGAPYPPLENQLRNIVATSAISHGVDVDRFNSMFFAGLPSDIAEYIQASSRVGRTHVGFVMLVPTPQSRRDRYVVETHDIFHRFLERMIAPPAVERWAENALRRVLASVIQAWAIMQENKGLVRSPDDRKSRVECFETIAPIRALIQNDPAGFISELGDFVLRAIGFEGRGSEGHGRPVYQELYRGLIEREVNRFTASIRNFETPLRLYEYWDDSAAAFKPPMTSLRDVDEAGIIAAAAYDARIIRGRRNINQDELIHVMRAIRNQRGSVAETDDDAPQGRAAP